jgi:uncharacterized protein (UPF0332 family)
MITPEIQELLDYADEGHRAAKVLIDSGFIGSSAAQSYFTMFYLSQAMLLSKGLKYSSHSAVIAAYGKEFSKTKLLNPNFHRYIIDTEERREDGHYGAGKMCPMQTRSNLSNGQRNLCKLSKNIWGVSKTHLQIQLVASY